MDVESARITKEDVGDVRTSERRPPPHPTSMTRMPDRGSVNEGSSLWCGAGAGRLSHILLASNVMGCGRGVDEKCGEGYPEVIAKRLADKSTAHGVHGVEHGKGAVRPPPFSRQRGELQCF